MTFAARVDDLVRPLVPAKRLAAVRLLVGAFALVYLVARLPAWVSPAAPGSPFRPVGPVHLVHAPLPGWVAWIALSVALGGSIAFLVGWRFKIAAPIFAAALLWLTSYRNSFGMIFHTENMLVLHVALLSITDATAAYSVDARRVERAGGGAAADARRFGFALFLLASITTLTYVLAGIAKLRISGLHWITGDVLRNHIAHDNARKALLGDGHSVLGGWLVRHPWIFPPFAAGSVVLELGAPLALFGKRIARVWCLGLWAFHVGVLALMWIFFPYPLSFIAYAPFFEAERFVEWVRARASRLAQKPEPSAALE
ncbi:MAG TPA: HTTM domain-containing protein [Polyangiaceae bacterium]|nr:HTTM domain-containing protein [Polyangiaceae bacterium]